MTEVRLSIAHGPSVDDLDQSHLQKFQKVVQDTPNAIAVISRYQSGQEVAWLDDPHKVSNEIQWTYRDLDSGARRLSGFIESLTAHAKGPIAAVLVNQVEWALLFWAAAYAQCPFVPINPAVVTRQDEIQHMLRVIGPTIIFASDSMIAANLEANLDRNQTQSSMVRILLDGARTQELPLWMTLLDTVDGPLTPPRTPNVPTANNAIVILFTSGTTSLPKPCALTSAQCVNAALGLMDAHGVQSNHVLLQHLPGFHSYGISWPLGFWLRGANVVFSSPTFDAQASLRCIQQYQITHMPLVPTMGQVMLSQQALSSVVTNSLLSIDLAGAGVLPGLVDALQATFHATVTSSYGMTESPGTLAWPSNKNTVDCSAGVVSGFPVRNAVVKICAPGTHDAVPCGQAGELHNGGVQVISGYMAQQTSLSLFYQDDQGVRWIISGDQAVMHEDGMIRICGRYKDMIIRGGENISPASIETYLAKRAGVSDVQVVGIPDELAGEVPVAVIDAKRESEALLAHLKQEAVHDLGPALSPKILLYLHRHLGLDAFPTTASGKIRKHELAEAVQRYLASAKTCDVHREMSTINNLIAIWEEVSGYHLCQPHTLVASFADSIMMMQLSGIVKRRLGKDITVEKLKNCTTIQEQANLIDSAPNRVTSVDINNQMAGDARNPHCDQHTHNGPSLDSELESAVTATLEHNGLTWADVEDTMQLPDWNAIFCQRNRPSSWNLRFSYSAKVDAAGLEKAIKQSLAHHSTFRALYVKHGAEHRLITLRSTPSIIAKIVTCGWRVSCNDELDGLLLHDRILDNTCAPGPLARFHIASVEGGTSGVVVVLSHAISDMTMARLWLDDIAAILSESSSSEEHVPFRQYAKVFCRHRTGREADIGVKYWTSKLKSIGSTDERTLWPPQRAPEWFKGVDIGWCRASGMAARSNERNLSMVTKLQAQKGIRRKVEIRDILQLKREHNIPVYMLVKTAIVIMNIALTGSKEAIFSTINAARSWPFKADYTQAELDVCDRNPLNISGCTTEYLLDRIAVSRNKSIIATMQQVTEDEELNQTHVHAPFFRIVDELRDPLDRDDNRTFMQRERDAEALLPLIRRQSFNWQPFTPWQESGEGLQFQEMVSRMDNGLTILGFLAEDKRSVILSFSWDAEHLTLREAQAALELLASLVETMGMHESWEMSVDDLIRT